MYLIFFFFGKIPRRAIAGLYGSSIFNVLRKLHTFFHSDFVVLVQLLSRVWLLQPYELQHTRLPCPSPSPSLLKLMSIESVMLSYNLILCHPLLLLPSIFPSIRVFPNESALCLRWPKYWSFSFSISPSNEHSGVISFRTDRFALAVQGTLNSLLQHHSLTLPIYIPANSAQGFPFLQILTNTYLLSFWPTQ